MNKQCDNTKNLSMVDTENDTHKANSDTNEGMLNRDLLWSNIKTNYRTGEETTLHCLLKQEIMDESLQQETYLMALSLINNVRQQKPKAFSIQGFLQSHHLSSQEGLALMSLSEALLRVPDTATKNTIIREKISEGNWVSAPDDPLVSRLMNVGLLATGKFLNLGFGSNKVVATIGSLIRRFSEPVVRTLMIQAIKIMGHQFIVGESIEQAIANGKELFDQGYTFSYDMLGEGARTRHDAERYLKSYQNGITKIAETIQSKDTDDFKDIYSRQGISIKLTALYPRFEITNMEQAISEVVPILLGLCKMAKEAGISLTVDAEESERLELSLAVMEKVFCHEDLKGWDGFGLAVQAYQKRAPYVIDWAISLAKAQQKRIGIRLVKGAYWDSEIKRTQENGLADYPVYTQKVHTDVSYMACADKMMQAAKDFVYPQFATHNAYTLAFVYQLAQKYKVEDYEFQRLYGMGDALYQQAKEATENKVRCRIYAPVGVYSDLLAYLVRRMLENGANSSFVNQIYDHNISPESLAENPAHVAVRNNLQRNPKIPMPKHIMATSPADGGDFAGAVTTRNNSGGVDLSDTLVAASLETHVRNYQLPDAPSFDASEAKLKKILDNASSAFDRWRKLPVGERASCFDRLGDLLQSNMDDLIAVLAKEAKKTIKDAVAEIREAIDFCYYYANLARKYQQKPLPLPGPTGEVNQISYQGRGVFLCISPWNFPLAIFLGQAVGALVSGNAVIAKPASCTTIVADMVVKMAHQVGVPKEVFQLAPVPADVLTNTLMQDSRIAGVAFTGSTGAALDINRTLASRNSAIVPLIAETGGINAMIVDSSALCEQAVDDIITSAFHSAGQRCSCLRLLFLQQEIADNVLTMLKGAMAELKIGSPDSLATDVGPVIHQGAYNSLAGHVQNLEEKGAELLYKCEVPEGGESMHYFPPQVWMLKSARDLENESFGPILHVVKYRGDQLDKVIEDINSTGYGLTLGLHTRLDTTIQQVCNDAKVGNIYVNRHMTGAVVASQPFGGQGLSGTGPKAGGPGYLQRFMVEVAFSQNMTASGGNASLLSIA